MSLIKPNTLYAHTNGHTDVCYSDDGKYVITCGGEGDMRVWQGVHDADPQSAFIDKYALSVVSHGDNIYCGSSNPHVFTLSLPRGERNGVISRFTAACTSLSVSPDGEHVAGGSCDMTINVTNTKTFKTSVLRGHTGPVFGVALDPKGEFLASSSGDGSMVIWNLKEENVSQKLQQTVPTCNDFFSAQCLGKMSWQPDGRILAVPVSEKVELITRNTWKTLTAFSDPEVKNCYYSITSFSPCGKLLAAGCTQGVVSIWDVGVGVLLHHAKYDLKVLICSLAWNPSDELKLTGKAELAVCDSNGRLAAIQIDLPDANIQKDKEEIKSNLDVDDIDLGNGDKSDEDNAGSDDDAVSISSVRKSESVMGKRVDEPDEDKYQCAFQPTSTPEGLTERYLACNDVGVVQTFENDNDNESIEVRFHDSSVHATIAMRNYSNFNIVSLSRDVVVYSGESKDSDLGSKLLCQMLQNRDGMGQWTTHLPKNEETVALAAGENFIAVGTTCRNIRLFSLTGNQREVLAIPGRIVCLAASKTKLMIVYHGGAGFSGDQVLWHMFVNVSNISVNLQEPAQALPLSSNSKLDWCGFTDELRPCTFDSEGILRILSYTKMWQPVYDKQIQIRPTDHLFVMGVSESGQVMRCILCKGTRYPRPAVVPNIVELPIKLPLCELHTDKGELESKFMWLREVSKLLLNPLVSESSKSLIEPQIRTMDTSALKLFALACKQDYETRALDLYMQIPTPRVRELARKYANERGKTALVERLCDMEEELVEEYASLSRQESFQVMRGSYMSYADPSNEFDSYVDEGAYSHDNGDSSMRSSFRVEDEDSQPRSETIGGLRRLPSLESRASKPRQRTESQQVNPFRKFTNSLAPLPVGSKTLTHKTNKPKKSIASEIIISPCLIKKKTSYQSTLTGFTSSLVKPSTPVDVDDTSYTQDEITDTSLLVDMAEAELSNQESNHSENGKENLEETETQMDIIEDSQTKTPDKSIAPTPISNNSSNNTSNFKKWFQNNETELKEKHPDADQVALVKIGAALFKKEKRSNQNESEKRKTEETKEEAIAKRAKTTSKLMGFAFQKK